MTRFDSTRPDPMQDAFSTAATPEQAAALYDEQARKAAAIEAALDGMGFAALPAMSVRSLDAMTQRAGSKPAPARSTPVEPSEN